MCLAKKCIEKQCSYFGSIPQLVAQEPSICLAPSRITFFHYNYKVPPSTMVFQNVCSLAVGLCVVDLFNVVYNTIVGHIRKQEFAKGNYILKGMARWPLPLIKPPYSNIFHIVRNIYLIWLLYKMPSPL